MHGVFLDTTSFHPDDLDFSNVNRLLASCEYYDHTNNEDIITRLQHADLAIVNKTVLTEAELRSCPKLKLICVGATGTNNIDLEAAARLSISVCNVRNYGTASVVQHVFSLILALNNRLIDYNKAALDGSWSLSDEFCLMHLPIRELTGKKMGIIGYGQLGKGVEKIAKAFDMEILIAQRNTQDTTPNSLPLAELVKLSDVISIHCPLTAETKNLISLKEMKQMKSSAIIINTARGGIVNEEDLATALRNRIIAGAGIDTLSTEPPPADHPLLAYDIPNLIVTPHNAWASQESRQRLVNQIATNIQSFLDGNLNNRVI